MCTEHEEDDIHFLLHSPVYHDLRVKYLSPFHSLPNEISFTSMLQMEDSNIITGLSLYIYITQFNAEKHIVTHCNIYVTLCLLCVLTVFLYYAYFVRAIGLANKLFVFESILLYAVLCTICMLHTFEQYGTE